MNDGILLKKNNGLTNEEKKARKLERARIRRHVNNVKLLARKKLYNAKYQASNREKVLEDRKVNQELNKDRILLKKKLYYEKNRSLVLSKVKERQNRIREVEAVKFLLSFNPRNG